MVTTYLVASCVNSPDILKENLLASPDIQSGALPIRLLHDASSAASAYHPIVAEQAADVAIFVHQDVYLPPGFKSNLDEAICYLNQTSPAWAVAGAYGATKSGRHVGHIYDGSNSRVLGQSFAQAESVAVLDEMLIIVRTKSGVNFDRHFPGFHLYGTQIAIDADAKGRGTFVCNLPIVHNSRSIVNLGPDYEEAWRYLSKHFGDHLPVPNLTCGITTRARWPLFKWRLRNAIALKLGRRALNSRASDAPSLAKLLAAE